MGKMREKKKQQLVEFFTQYAKCYSKCPKISYTKVSDKMAYANSADPEEQSDQGLHCLPFC